MSLRSDCNENVTMLSNPEPLLCDGRQIDAASIAAKVAGNLLVAPLLLEAALQEMATLYPQT